MGSSSKGKKAITYATVSAPVIAPTLAEVPRPLPTDAAFCILCNVASTVCPNLPSASMEEEAVPAELGALIKRLRLSHGYSQEAFAEACGIERAYMSSIERSRVNASVRTAFRLARGLDLTLAVLFGMLERRDGDGDPGR